jgi:hypothetical protein
LPTNSLGADVALNNTSNYFDGPSVAQGSTGSWFASGTVSLKDTGIAGSAIYCKLWDGTTVISSGVWSSPVSGYVGTISVSGYIASPAGNIRISCKDVSLTTGIMLFNQSGNSKDSTVSVHRIQ